MSHFGEKTKINLDFGRFCIIFVLKLRGLRLKTDLGQIYSKDRLTVEIVIDL